MADYRRIIRHFPPVRDYIRNRQWVRRGDVVAYAPNILADHFSTDGVGFRRTLFDGRHWGLIDCLAAPRHMIIMGSSHVFGFGLPSDADSFASQLSVRLGYPCATVAFPEAETRSLHAVLLNILSSAQTMPVAVVLFTGGDLTRFAFSGKADRLFGSPNIVDSAKDATSAGLVEGPNGGIDAMIAYSSLWISTIADLMRRSGIPLILADDATFMEKPRADAIEIECGLGSVGAQEQARRFDTQRLYGERCYDARRSVAERLQLPLIGPDKASINYIDEFHYRSGSIGEFCDLLAKQIDD